MAADVDVENGLDITMNCKRSEKYDFIQASAVCVINTNKCSLPPVFGLLADWKGYCTSVLPVRLGFPSMGVSMACLKVLGLVPGPEMCL